MLIRLECSAILTPRVIPSPGIPVVCGRQVLTVASLECLEPRSHHGAFRGPVCCGDYTQGCERHLGRLAMDAANLRNLHGR